MVCGVRVLHFVRPPSTPATPQLLSHMSPLNVTQAAFTALINRLYASCAAPNGRQAQQQVHLAVEKFVAT